MEDVDSDSTFSKPAKYGIKIFSMADSNRHTLKFSLVVPTR